MKSYFPLADYDFYAFVLVGFLALLCGDLAFDGGTWILNRASWSIIDGISVVIGAYVTGQVIAMVAGLVLEKWFVCRGLGPPRLYLLDAQRPVPRLVNIMNGVSANHNSGALPAAIAKKAIDNTAAALGERPSQLRIAPTWTEEIFQYGYAVGRRREDSCRRLDRDRREYEFSRNLSFLGLVGGPMLIRSSPAHPGWVGWVVLSLAVIMFVRFFRYFQSFHTQVIREAAFAHLPK